MNQDLQDLRHALHTFTSNSGFTILSVMTLALGIGADTTIFTVINTLRPRPLPVEQPERLAKVHSRSESGDVWVGSITARLGFTCRDLIACLPHSEGQPDGHVQVGMEDQNA